MTAAGSPLKASMLRDIEGGKPVEGDQILGDLLRRAAKPDDHSLLRIATLHVKAYEAGRKRSEIAAKLVTLAPRGALVYPRPFREHLKEKAPWRTPRRSTGPMQ